jgi:hypothetical protein
MGPIAIVTGAILIVCGVGGYLATMTSLTALIPAALGLLLVVFGVFALQEKMRMHAMHGAVLIGLIGFLGGASMVVRALLSDKEINPVSFGMQIAMGLICAVFVGLCVKSFIDARRRRQQQHQSGS